LGKKGSWWRRGRGAHKRKILIDDALKEGGGREIQPGATSSGGLPRFRKLYKISRERVLERN